MITEQIESERCEYQERLFRTRNAQSIFKHFKSLNRKGSLPQKMYLGESIASTPEEKAELLNSFFHSVFSKRNSELVKVTCEKPVLTNFNVSKGRIKEILLDLDTTKTRGPNGLPPILYQKLAKDMSAVLNVLFKNIKRARKIPQTWKIAAVAPIHKKGERKIVSNYRPISLLNIDSKVFEAVMYKPLYEHFEKYMCQNQHGFMRKRSIVTNMLAFLKKIYCALDKNPKDEIVAVYTDFSKAFDTVPHEALLKKVAAIGVGCCFLDLLADYLYERKQYVRVDNTDSSLLEVTSGVPQGSLLGPLLFCIFINDLPDVLVFSQPFLYADDLKILHMANSQANLQADLDSLNCWVCSNGMSLAHDKCYKINFRGEISEMNIGAVKLQQMDEVKDLGILVNSGLNWASHVNYRIKKSNKAFFYIKRNVSYRLQTHIKLNLYKSLLLPVLLFASECYSPSRTDCHRLETFQRRVVHWIAKNPSSSYRQKLIDLNVLPIPMYIQLKNLLIFATVIEKSREVHHVTQNQQIYVNLALSNSRTKAVTTLMKTRTENARSEFSHRTGRIANAIHLASRHEQPNWPEGKTTETDVEILLQELLRVQPLHMAITM